VTWHFLFLALPGSALRPYNWPYSERYRWAKTCPGHRTAACGRSSRRAGTSAHIAVSAREGALPPPGSGEVFAGELARRLGPRLHRLGHDVDRRVRARAAKRQPAAVMPAVNAAPMNGASISATPWLGGFGCAGRLIGAGCEAGIDHGSRAAKRPIKISNEDRVQTYRANSFQRAALSQAPAGPISLGLSAACQGLQGEVEGGGGDGGQAAGVQVGYAGLLDEHPGQRAFTGPAGGGDVVSLARQSASKRAQSPSTLISRRAGIAVAVAMT